MRSLFFLLVLFFGITFHATAGEIIINFSDPMFAKLDAEGKKLLSEYARAYPKIRGFYENMRMDMDIRNTSYRSEKDLESLTSALRSEGQNEDEIRDVIARSGKADVQHEVRYRQLDGYARVDTKVERRITSSVLDKLPSGSPLPSFVHGGVVQDVEVVLLTPEMSYQLSKRDPSKQYFALNAKRNPDSPNAEDIGLPLMYVDTAPFCEDADPLEKVIFDCPPLLKGKPYIVEYVKQMEVEGERVVMVKCSRADLIDSFREIRLDRNFGVVKETYSRGGVTFPDGKREIRWTRETCTYDGMVDGIPLLKTYQRSSGIFDQSSQEEMITRQMMCEVTNLIPGPVDLSEFDVAQFLPPNVKIRELSWSPLSPARIAGMVIGTLLFMIGIYLKIRSMRKEQITNP